MTSDNGGAPADEAARAVDTGLGTTLPVSGWRAILDRVRYPEQKHSPSEIRRNSLIVAVALIVAYWFTQEPLADWTSSNPDLNFYLIQPLVWTGLAFLSYYMWRRLPDAPDLRRVLIGLAIVGGVFHVAVWTIAGMIGDFGDSPIAGRLINYPKNGLFITTWLLGLETSRAYLLWAWRRWNRYVALTATTILLAIATLPMAQLTGLGDFDQPLRLVGGRWVPALLISAVATLLAEYGGMGPSFGYRFALLAFEWFAPELPDLDWDILLVVALIGSVGAWLVTRSIYEGTDEYEADYPLVDREFREEEDDWPEEEAKPWWRWPLMVGAPVLLVLLLLVGFGVRPFVVSGISMEPAYERGDVAFVRDVSVDSLEVGDVIKFSLGSIEVMHRIIEFRDDGTIITQGDNVASPDPPVTPDRIDGKVVFVLPKIGIVSLWLDDLFN